MIGKRKFFIVIALTLLSMACDLESDKSSGGTQGNSNNPANASTYTVTFDANGATSGTPPSSERATSGTEIRLPDAGNLLKTNFNFGGWNTNSAGTGINYPSGSVFTVQNNDITLYAKWESIPPNGTPDSIPIPTAPTKVWAQVSFIASPKGSYEVITVSWNAVSSAIGYHVWRALGVTDNRFLISSVTDTSYADTNLLSNTTYFYWVSAYNGSGVSAQSSPATATTGSSNSGVSVGPGAPVGPD